MQRTGRSTPSRTGCRGCRRSAARSSARSPWRWRRARLIDAARSRSNRSRMMARPMATPVAPPIVCRKRIAISAGALVMAMAPRLAQVAIAKAARDHRPAAEAVRQGPRELRQREPEDVDGNRHLDDFGIRRQQDHEVAGSPVPGCSSDIDPMAVSSSSAGRAAAASASCRSRGDRRRAWGVIHVHGLIQFKLASGRVAAASRAAAAASSRGVSSATHTRVIVIEPRRLLARQQCRHDQPRVDRGQRQRLKALSGFSRLRRRVLRIPASTSSSIRCRRRRSCSSRARWRGSCRA